MLKFRLYSSVFEKEGTHLLKKKKKVYIYVYMDHLKDSLGRKVETIETETRKMDNTLFQQEDLNFHENSSWPST